MRDTIEKEFLSVLYSKPEIGFDLLQIKPTYLENKNNQKLFTSMLDSYKKLGIVDISYIMDNNPDLIDLFTEIISEDYLPLIDVRKSFISSQCSILDFYKKKVISQLTEKLNSGNITINSYLEKMGKIQTIQIITESNSLTLDELNKNIDTNKTRILLRDFSKLDNLLELVEGDFLVIGASTGTVKSGLLLNLMNSLMGNYQCIYFNLEMSKSTIYKRMLAISSDVPVRYISNPESEYQQQAIEAAKNKIVKSKIVVEHESMYLEDIENCIKVAKNEDKKHTILFLDHIGLIRIKSNNRSIYEQTTDVVKGLRQLCLKYDCTIIGACQLNRSSYNANEINLSMLKDSGEIENSASKIILLYRNKEYSSDHLEPEMILDVCKNRDGMEGQISCIYYKTKQIFKEKL